MSEYTEKNISEEMLECMKGTEIDIFKIHKEIARIRKNTTIFLVIFSVTAVVYVLALILLALK